MKHTNYNAYFTLIVAACCYLQNKQPSDWTVPINHVKRVCLKLRVKPMNALKFVDKWAEIIHKWQVGEENTGLDLKESDINLLTYKRVKTFAIEEGKERTDEASYKEKWLGQNVQFMHSAIGKAVRILVDQIDTLLLERKFHNDDIVATRESDFINDCLLLPNANYRMGSKIFRLVSLEEFKKWVLQFEAAFYTFLKERHDLLVSLFWSKCANIRLSSANVAVMIYHIRS